MKNHWTLCWENGEKHHNTRQHSQFGGFFGISIVKNFYNNSHPFWRPKSSPAIRTAQWICKEILAAVSPLYSIPSWAPVPHSLASHSCRSINQLIINSAVQRSAAQLHGAASRLTDRSSHPMGALLGCRHLGSESGGTDRPGSLEWDKRVPDTIN